MEQAPPTRLREYLHVVRRRKWTIVQAALLVPAVAVFFSLRQQPRYHACSQVLLSRQNLANSLNGIQDPSAYLQPERVTQTEADVARAPAVARRVVDRLHGVRTVAQLSGESSVTPRPDADFLSFCVTDRDRELAAAFATEYARQFIVYRRQLDTSALVAAREEVTGRIAQLAAAGQSRSALYESLVEKEQQLSTMATLVTANRFLIGPAVDARQVSPRPVRNGLLGLVLGLAFGLALAFLWEALDTRLRTGEAVSDRLGIPLLGRIPRPSRRMRDGDRLAMLEEPTSLPSEAYRTLRANLEYAGEDRGVHTIMVTSALDGEGKSTTAANLAVALARVGRDVVLIDLDLRRPSLHRFFGLNGRPGVTHVAFGRARLEESLVRIPILTAPTNGNGVLPPPTAGQRRRVGSLRVLGSGALPPDPGEFAASGRLRELLGNLAESSDVVLVDAPPLLGVGDALAASGAVDALVLVSRLEKLRRPVLDELKRVLDRCPAPALGFVVTGADADHAYGYGYGYA
jgi:Mrp family chromosome partitioning ATPase